MRPLLDDAARGHDGDPVGRRRGRETVRDEQHGPTLAQLADRLEDLGLGHGVELGGRLVEDEHRRVLEERAGEGEPLRLAAGQPRAVLAERRVEPVRELGHERVEPCEPDRPAQSPRRSPPGRARSRFSRSVPWKSRGRCGTQATARRHSSGATRVERAAAGEKPPGRGLQEAQQERGGRRLPRPRRPDERHRRAGRDVQGEAVERRRKARCVREGDVREAHRRRCGRRRGREVGASGRRDGVGAQGRRWPACDVDVSSKAGAAGRPRLVEKDGQAIGRLAAGHPGVERGPERAQRPVELRGEDEDTERRAELQPSVEEAQADLDGHDRGAQRRERLEHERRHEGEAQHLHRHSPVALARGLERARLVRRAPEGPQRRQARRARRGSARTGARGAPTARASAPGPPCRSATGRAARAER